MESSPYIVPEPVKREAESSEDETIMERKIRMAKHPKKVVPTKILSVPDSTSQLLPVPATPPPVPYKPRKMIYDEQEL